MPTNHTPNYNLSQWQKADKVLMEDFNADNAKIDGAIKAEADARSALAVQVAQKADKSALSSLASEVAQKAETSALAALTEQVGTLNCRAYLTVYAGNGDESRTITFPSKPWLVFTLMSSSIGTISIQGCRTGMVIIPTTHSTYNPVKVTWSENSVTLNQPNGFVNQSGTYYTLFALIEA